MMMGGLFRIFVSLSLGYVLCVLAKKQDGLLRTVGYTIGISMMVISLLYGLLGAEMKYNSMKKVCGMQGCMDKSCKCMAGKPSSMPHR